MKCKICGFKTRSLPAMGKHYRKKHPQHNRLARAKREKGDTLTTRNWKKYGKLENMSKQKREALEDFLNTWLE